MLHNTLTCIRSFSQWPAQPPKLCDRKSSDRIVRASCIDSAGDVRSSPCGNLLEEMDRNWVANAPPKYQHRPA